ncbi:hypothetical protein B0H16DRAFT_1482432 [Mycena metata]|uniref:Uncharacterized protein n=1 Tax=Mycena metata TaxID=1033252 RepID=A0AAD7GTY6_9AGAR|nr:hypothetical protein B0H16DRAFT_1482432 [Mycena metata]
MHIFTQRFQPKTPPEPGSEGAGIWASCQRTQRNKTEDFQKGTKDSGIPEWYKEIIKGPCGNTAEPDHLMLLEKLRKRYNESRTTPVVSGIPIFPQTPALCAVNGLADQFAQAAAMASPGPRLCDPIEANSDVEDSDGDVSNDFPVIPRCYGQVQGSWMGPRRLYWANGEGGHNTTEAQDERILLGTQKKRGSKKGRRVGGSDWRPSYFERRSNIY